MSPLFRVLYRLYRWYSSLRHWAQRRFTRTGLALAGGLIVAALMAPDTDNNTAYQAFTLLLFLLLLALCFSWFFRADFVVARRMPRFGTVGLPLVYTVELRNRTSKTQAGLALLENLSDPRPDLKEWLAAQRDQEKHLRSFRFSNRRRTHPFRAAVLKDTAVPPAPPHQDLALRCELTPLRRGVLRLSGVALARPDPLGLFRGLAKFPAAQTVLVLPKRYPLPPLALPGTTKYQQGGISLAANVGQSDEFVSLRDYRPGDPWRHIHWRSWARAGKPVVKEFEDEFFVRHALVLDTFTEDFYSESFEEAVSVAASFACTLPTQESLLDLLFVGPESYVFTAGRGLAQADQMLEILASVRPCRERPFQTLEGLALSHIHLVSGCICVLLAWDQPRRQFVEKMLALGVPVRVLVVLGRGQESKIEPGPMWKTPERFHVLVCGQIEECLAKLK